MGDCSPWFRTLGALAWPRSEWGASGAADRGAFRLGARLLAQSYTAAALEVTFGGLSVRARGDLQVALTGAQAPAAVDGRGVGYFGPFMVADGQILTLGTPQVGLRSYLSVRGGVARRSGTWALVQPTPCPALGPPPVQSRRRAARRSTPEGIS